MTTTRDADRARGAREPYKTGELTLAMRIAVRDESERRIRCKIDGDDDGVALTTSPQGVCYVLLKGYKLEGRHLFASLQLGAKPAHVATGRHDIGRWAQKHLPVLLGDIKARLEDFGVKTHL